MTGFYKSFCPFFSKCLHIHFNPSKIVSPILLLNALVMKGRLLANVSKKEMSGDMPSNIAHFAHICNISNVACHKKSLKFNLFFISKFKTDQVHGKTLNDTHLKVI